MAQYNPFGPTQRPLMQQPQQGGDPALQATAPQSNASAPITGRQWGNGQAQEAAGNMVGQLYKGQLLDNQWGTGTTGTAAKSLAQIDALKGSMSQANPADIAAQDQMRSYYSGAIGNLGTLGDLRGTALDTQMQRGLTNLLDSYKNQRAGTGGINSSQFGRGQGQIASNLGEQYTKGLSDLSGQQLQNAGMIQGGLGNILNQDVNERNLQYSQAKGLSDLYGQQMDRDSGYQQQQAAKNAGKTDWMSDVAPLVGMGAGALIGGPQGAMIGGQLGGMAGGQHGGMNSGGQMGMGLGQMMNSGGYGGGGYSQQPWYANGGTPVSDGLQGQFNGLQSIPYSGYNSGYAPAPSLSGGLGYSPYKIQ